MFRQCGFSGIALVAGLLATGAAASDIEVIDAPEIRLGEASAGGWYVRGDVGYSGWVKGARPSYKVSRPGGAVSSVEGFDTARFSRPVSFGAGLGYQFNPFLRADLTADAFNGRLTGTSDITAPCAGEAAGTRCGFAHKAGYSAASVMANGYLELGTVMGFTPYVGAGLGATHLRWDDMKNGVSCLGAACSGAAHAGTTFPGRDSWRFTYALAAGASYDVTERIKLDFGYRFTDVGGGATFGYGAAERGWGASGVKGSDSGFQKHAFRVGLRISAW